MISDNLGPYHRAELEARDDLAGVLGFRLRRLESSRPRRLPNSRLVKLLLGSLFLQALLYVSARKLSPVDMIAQHILASLLANATATSRSGFLARIATIHSAREPLYLWATRRTEVQPTTSILRRYRLPFLVIAPSFSLPPLEC